MKNTILILIALFTLTITSCKKEVVEPYYQYEEDPYDPKSDIDGYYQNQTDGYTDGGTLPTLTSDSSFLSGTKWVLISFRRNGYLYNTVNDTLEFVSNNKYVLYKNGAGAEKTYTLVQPTGAPTGTYTLTLHEFFSFGSSDSYSGLIHTDVITFGEIYTDFDGNYYGDEIREATFKQL